MIGHLRALKLIGLARASGKALSDDALAIEWRAVDAVKAAAEEPMQEATRLWLRRALQDAADAMGGLEDDQLPAAKNRVQASQVVDLILDLPGLVASLVEMLSPQVARTLRAGFEAGRLRLPTSVGLSFDAERPEVVGVIRQLVGKAESVPSTLRDQIVTAVRDGLDASEDAAALARRIRALSDTIPETQARAIARTTGTGAFEAGQLDSFRQVGADRRWLSSRDGDVRPSHLAADGQEVGTDEPFTVGGYTAMHPSDPALPASESINCRCTVLPVIRSERTYAQTRNAEIRERYRALPRTDRTAETRAALADEYCVSVETIERAIYRKP